MKALSLTTARYPLSSLRRWGEGLRYRVDNFGVLVLLPAVKFLLMENVASVWLLFGIGLIALNILSQRFSFGSNWARARVLKLFFDYYFSIFVLIDQVCQKSSLCSRFRVFKLWKHRGEYEAD